MKSDNTVIGAIINSMFSNVALHSAGGIKYYFNLVIHYTTIDHTFHVLMCKYVYISY